jgi:hypothetical protein
MVLHRIHSFDSKGYVRKIPIEMKSFKIPINQRGPCYYVCYVFLTSIGTQLPKVIASIGTQLPKVIANMYNIYMLFICKFSFA